MHASSIAHMERLIETYGARLVPSIVYDVGSRSDNGAYRALFQERGWTYLGIDIEPGPNVDIVLDEPYRLAFEDDSAALIVSGQAFEHIEFFWVTFNEMARVLAPGGLIFLIAPSRGHEHRYPVDCWRFFPDGFRALAKWGGLELLEVETDWRRRHGPWYARRKDIWGDTVGVFAKPRPRQ